MFAYWFVSAQSFNLVTLACCIQMGHLVSFLSHWRLVDLVIHITSRRVLWRLLIGLFLRQRVLLLRHPLVVVQRYMCWRAMAVSGYQFVIILFLVLNKMEQQCMYCR